MKNALVTCFILVSFGISCTSDKNGHSPANKTEANIYRSADSMLAAFKRKDWQTFASYNHPAITKMMGGEQAFASFIREQMNQIPDTAIKRIQAGKILQLIKTNNDQQCVIEQTMEMHIEGVKISDTTYLIGESLDGGRNWTFLDASVNARAPKDIKADISSKLRIPAKKRDMQKL
jgi:hypothetical protein